MDLPTLYISAFVLAAWYLLRRWWRLDLDKIPCPTVPEGLQMITDQPRANQFFRKWHEKYGPIFRIWLVYREMVLVADPQVAAQVLGKGPQYIGQKAAEYASVNPAHGMHGHSGMLSHLDEKIWKAHRQAIAPAYTLSALKHIQPAIVESMVAMAARLSASTSGGPADVRVDHEVMGAAIQVLIEAFMNLDMKELDINPLKVADDMGQLMEVCQDFTGKIPKKIFYTTPWLVTLTEDGRRFHEARLRFSGLTERIYDQIQATTGPDPDEGDFSLAACFMRLEDPHKGGRASKAAVAAEIANSFHASETVPLTAAWTLYLLARHPKVQQRLASELVAAGVPVGTGDHEAVGAALMNPDTIKALPYLQAVINESMRLCPAGSPASVRVADRTVVVGGYRIPAGTYIWPCLYSFMTYSGNWERPLEFDPSRWEDPSAATHPESGGTRFIPYSLGPKGCAGQNLAILEVRTALIMLLANWEWGVAPRMGSAEQVMAKTRMGVTLTHEGGIWLTATPRQ